MFSFASPSPLRLLLALALQLLEVFDDSIDLVLGEVQQRIQLLACGLQRGHVSGPILGLLHG